MAADAPQAALLVVGDCMLDHYWDGRVERISPEAPELVESAGIGDGLVVCDPPVPLLSDA